MDEDKYILDQLAKYDYPKPKILAYVWEGVTHYSKNGEDLTDELETKYKLFCTPEYDREIDDDTQD